MQPPDSRCVVIEFFRPVVDNPEYLTTDSRNKDVVTYSPMISAATGSNNATILLTTMAAAKSAIQYIVDYINKSKVELSDAVTLKLLEAYDHIQKYPSKAADKGTGKRGAQHLATRAINLMSSMNEEYSSQQVCAILLGQSPVQYTTDTWICFATAAVRSLLNGMRLQSQAVRDAAGSWTDHSDCNAAINMVSTDGPVTAHEPTFVEDESDISNIIQDPDNDPADHADADGVGNVVEQLPVTLNKSGQAIVSWQDQQYDFRCEHAVHAATNAALALRSGLNILPGTGLPFYSLYDFTAILELCPVGKDDKATSETAVPVDVFDNSDTNPSAVNVGDAEDEHFQHNAKKQKSGKKGRTPASRFRFNAKIGDFAECKQLELRSVHRLPVLSGGGPPRFPGTKKNTTQWRTQARIFAQYALRTFAPCCCDPECRNFRRPLHFDPFTGTFDEQPLTFDWNGLCRWMETAHRWQEYLRNQTNLADEEKVKAYRSENHIVYLLDVFTFFVLSHYFISKYICVFTIYVDFLMFRMFLSKKMQT